MHKNIVLVGLMGAGKTTVGKLLAQNLEMNFVDTDKMIEITEGKTIPEIFEKNGEDYFRKIETKIIENFSLQNNQIISTGGGSFQNLKNIELLKKNGIIFYLQADVNVLYNRIKNTDNRPLLKNDNPIEILTGLFKQREKNYLQANFIVNTNDKSLNEIIKEIIKVYNENS